MNASMRLSWLGLVVVGCVACGSDAAKKGEETAASSAEPSEKSKKKAKASAAPEASASATPTATASAANSAAPPSSAAAPSPATLATMFDGDDGKDGKTVTFGRATLRLPAGWDVAGGWTSVDVVERSDRSAKLVLMTLDISDAYLDLNLGTWVKVPFATDKVNWEPREAGKVGAGHLESKVAKGSGQFGKDKADFWHVATGFDGKTYALVAIAGIKSSAEPKVREEMIAAVRSIQIK